MQDKNTQGKANIEVNPEVLKAIAEADLARNIAAQAKQNSSVPKDSKEAKDMEKQLSDQMVGWL